MKAFATSNFGQALVLLLVGAGWLFSLVEFYAYHVAVAQPFADAGWGALLAILKVDFGTTTPTPAPAPTA